jgi:AbiV family abortive infection protein
MPHRPKPGPLLEAAFRKAQANNCAYEFLSDGIKACLENADSLAKEFSCLASNGFNARAQFVMATAMEELGKALILFDLVRIPWDKKEWITALCKAFYNHLNKAAYAKTVFFPGSGAIADALVLYKLDLIAYWPNNDPESGEPDEHASGLIDREWGLYVDWVEFDGKWFQPNSSTLAYYYAQDEAWDGITVGKDRIDRVLTPMLQAEAERLFTPEALKTVHSVMSSINVSINTAVEEVAEVSEYTAEKLAEAGTKISPETSHSNFMLYPLYAAIVTPETIKGYWER